MLTVPQIEFAIALFLLYWWGSTLYDAVSRHSWMRGAPCFPLAVLAVYYFLLAFEVAGLRQNMELRTTVLRWMLGIVAVTEGTIKLFPVLSILWLLATRSSFWSRLSRWFP